MKTGESYSGDELVKELGGDENFVNDRLYAMGNDDIYLVLEDEGNDNYRIICIVDIKKKEVRLV